MTFGSDSHSCEQAKNPATAKQTTHAGISCLKGGETLIVKSGVYDEQFENNEIPSGTAGNPTIVKSETQYGAVIRRTSTGRSNWTFFFTDSHDIVIDGFTLDNTFVQADTAYGITTAGGCNNMVFQNMDIFGGGAITGGLASFLTGSDFSDNYITYRKNKIHDVHVDQLRNNTNRHGQYGAYSHSDNTIYEYNEFYNIPGYGIHMNMYDSCPEDSSSGCDNNIFRNNVFRDIGLAGIIVNAGRADNLQIYNNLFIRTGIGQGYASAQGISIRTNADKMLIHHNTFYGGVSYMESVPLWIEHTGTKDAVVRDNIIWSNDIDNISDGGANTTLSNN